MEPAFKSPTAKVSYCEDSSAECGVVCGQIERRVGLGNLMTSKLTSRIAMTAAGVLAAATLPVFASAAPPSIPLLPDLDFGSLFPDTPPAGEAKLCDFTFAQPGGPTRTESVEVSVASAGEGKTKYVFRTQSVTVSPYTQAAAVTWANLDTGLSGGGYDSRTEAQISAGRTEVTLPVQVVGKGRITVVASVSNVAGNATSYDDCTGEYTAS